MTDEEISMVLNTYMYMDYREADDGMTVNEILEKLSFSEDCKPGGLHYGEYTILKETAENREIGELVIGNQSHLLSFDEGTNACTFKTGDGSSIYVVYRGTSDGEWPDNGMGMTETSTLQQERALDYFETVIKREHISEEQRLIITGHSKGGNKAQYVTMSTQYDQLVDGCYNIDGQGFSEKAVNNWKSIYTEEEYLRRTGKITGIYGENDYVHVLGHSIVPDHQIRYVKTPVEVENFAGYHDIKYMFATLETDEETGEKNTVFHGKKNCYATQQGNLGSYAALLSAILMELPPEERDGCAATFMQVMEMSGGRKSGINGEKLKLSDIEEFFHTGIPTVAGSIFLTREGWEMLGSGFFKKSFTKDMRGKITVMVDYTVLLNQLQMILKLEEKWKNSYDQIEDISKRFSLLMKNSWFLHSKIKKEMEKLDKAIREIHKLSDTLEQIIKIYITKDTETADEILML